MRRWLGWIAIAWLIALCSIALFAYGGDSTQQSLEQRTHAIAVELRCPVCQGQSVADSQSDIAGAIRTDIRKRLAKGQSPGQIRSYLLSRYPNISLAPTTGGIGGIAWLAPPLLLVGGLGLLATLVTDWRKRGKGAVIAARPEYIERVRRAVRDIDSERV